MSIPKVHLQGGGRFFPNAARCFHRIDPKMFLRVLEDVGRDYDVGRRSIHTSKNFYSHAKFKMLRFLKN